MEEDTRRWIEKARSDIKTAKYNLDGNKLDATLFFAQQSAEKGLKALLIKKNNQFPKIHDLIKLAKGVNAPDNIKELCAKINPSYIISRYPDIEQSYSKKECEEILNFAEEILKWVEENL